MKKFDFCLHISKKSCNFAGDLGEVSTMEEKSRKNLRYFYYEYRSEVVFGLLLSAAVVVSYMLSPLIPTDIFRKFISPFEISAVAVLSGVCAWFLARHHEGMRQRWISAWIMGALTLIFIYGYYIRLHGNTVREAAEGPLSFEGWEMVYGDIIAWFLLAYPSELLRPRWLTWQKALTRLLPVIIIGVIDYFVPWDLRWLLAIVPVVWVWLLLHHVRSYHKYCEDHFSSLEDTDERWVIRYLVMIFVLGGSYGYLCIADEPNRIFTQQWLMFFVLLYSNEQVIFRPVAWIERAEQKEARDENDEVSDEISKVMADVSSTLRAEYRRALEEWMETEKPYLKGDFRLSDMMQVVPINRTYLSQFIKSEYDCTFYQFVTNFRIEEAKRIMRANPDMRVQEIAEHCGFSSATVFGRVFLRETGLTPTEWLAQSGS